MNRLEHLTPLTGWTADMPKRHAVQAWAYPAGPRFFGGVPDTRKYVEFFAKVFENQSSGQVSRKELDECFARLEYVQSELLALKQSIQGRGIEKTPGICGGSARIVRSRIAVWTLESLRRKGVTEAALLDSYPTLTACDLVNAWAYVAMNRREIEEEIRENEED